ncbi:AraC family transcriptional regulator [Chitinophaga filiformis]|uniref:Helix-turn-helix transcriptional regulator n=1 Tax=Chitinophaga filiformis TaxID=104663 RepID=A0ABY4I712_CHIFI|nr:helix-turn-helix transcriptional regulator [Chitinophaga filiformis]UPK71680.1 helix-turn-helix transcriptional regulator [Chitinophaga filiformis]
MSEAIENKYAEILVSCVDEKFFKAEVVSEYHTLMRIFSGEMKIVQAGQSYTLGEGDILLVPRNQLCAVIKRPKDGRPYKSIVVTFKPDRLKTYYSHKSPEVSPASVQKIKTFESHPLLDSYFASMAPYFELTSSLPEEIVSLKIEEGISILRTLDKDADSILADFSEPGKINLAEFMEKNYMFNMPLTKFSYLTGRSIATFNRDFRKAFHISPQKWLTQKRLELAHYQLSVKKRKPVDVYIEAGFENISHFSFAFKKHFGYAPTELQKREGLA